MSRDTTLMNFHLKIHNSNIYKKTGSDNKFKVDDEDDIDEVESFVFDLLRLFDLVSSFKTCG